MGLFYLQMFGFRDEYEGLCPKNMLDASGNYPYNYPYIDLCYFSYVEEI